MSLQGTLETIPLPDVLALLAATKKTGELRVSGTRGDGRLWLRDGSVVAADVLRATTPVDAVFELLRMRTGTFAFDSGAAAPQPGEPVAVEALVAAAQARLAEWKAIEAVVPSTSCLVTLAAELAKDSVTISRRQWQDLVAVAGGGDVNGVMKRLRIGEFDACRTVKDLVDAGLVKVAAAATSAPEAPEPPAPPAPPSAAAPVAPESGAEAGGGSSGRRPASTPAPTQAAATQATPAAASRPAAQPASAPAAQPASAPAGSPAHARAGSPAPAPEGKAAPQPAPTRPAAPAPAPVASSRRSPSAPAEPRRAASATPTPDEADELVHQLASLSRPEPSAAPAAAPSSPTGKPAPAPAPAASAAPPRAAAAPPTPGPAKGSAPATEEKADGDADQEQGDGAPDEPINRGMLLKFLSSVRP